MTIEQIIAGELSVRPQQAAATLELLDSGNTIPFIARYRKEVTGSLDEEQIRMISERAQYLRNLEERRQEILESITSQEKLTPELESQIKAAVKMQELEDLYLPYRPKKRTRAQIARERGLEPLAELIMAQSQPLMTLDKLASLHVDPEKGVNSVSEAWAGASDIVAENISDRADIRDSGFVYCVSGQVNTFNPQKVSSGLIVDTLAAQIYDRLLDVDPYTYRLVPELAESWEVLDNGATYRFHLRRHVPGL